MRAYEIINELTISSGKMLPGTFTTLSDDRVVYEFRTATHEYKASFTIDPVDYDDAESGLVLDAFFEGKDANGSWTDNITNLGEKDVMSIYATMAGVILKILKAHPDIVKINMYGRSRVNAIYQRLISSNLTKILPGWRITGSGAEKIIKEGEYDPALGVKPVDKHSKRCYNHKTLTKETTMLSKEVAKSNRFQVTSQSGFARGFTVDLYVNGDKVGTYKYSIDHDGDAFHDVSIAPQHQRKGYGTMLVLKAIQTAHDYDLGYTYDSLGQTQDFDALQQSMVANGLVANSALTDKGEDVLFNFEHG